MPKFYVEEITKFEVEAADWQEAMVKYSDGLYDAAVIVQVTVYDENMDLADDSWGDLAPAGDEEGDEEG
jgi:hypothetical protein